MSGFEPIAELKGQRGFTGARGLRGLPGLPEVPADEGVAAYAEALDSETGQALSRRFERPVLVNPAGLDRFRKRLGEAFWRRVEVIVAGSSSVDGAWADDTGVRTVETQWLWAERGFVGQLRRLFAAQYGNAGEGFMSFPGDDMRWTLAAATREATAFAGTGLALGSGGSALIGLKAPISAVHVWTVHEPNNGAVRTIVDGADLTPTILTGAADALTGGWSSSQATVTYQTDTTTETFNVINAVTTTAGAVIVRTPIGALAEHPVTAGTWYQVQAGVRCVSALRSVACSIVFYDAAGAQVGTEQLGDYRTGAATNQYRQVAVTAQAPEGAVKAAVFIRATGAVVGDQFRIRWVKATPLLSRVDVPGGGGAFFVRYRVGVTAGTARTWRFLGGPGNVTHLLGIVAHEDGSAAIQIHGYGLSGSTVGPHAGDGLNAQQLAIQLAGTFNLFNPALVIGVFGSNDYNRQADFGTPAQFKTRLMVWVTAAVARGASVLLFAGTYWDNSHPIPRSEYNAVMREIAETNPHVSFADLSEVWGYSWTAANAKGLQWDSPHANGAGHGLIARIIFEILNRPSIPA